MAITYGRKRSRQNNVFYTIITVVLLCAVFLAMINVFQEATKEDAYEALHVQTKQIKDDLNLQLKSDFENLTTMANFAAKLYKDGESYDIMFESFRPIGLIANIGILNPDNTFVTKAGEINLSGKISFDDEKQKGTYLTGRVKDLTKDDNEIIRSAVPIIVDEEVVGVLYGVIKVSTINERYNAMAQELDAQLFVYEKESGNIIIDTIHDELGNISFLMDRNYIEGSYQQMMDSPNGFVAFVSKYRDNQNMHMHYSEVPDFEWDIALARYDAQVFEKMNFLTGNLFTVFFAILSIMILYMLILMRNEKMINQVTACASDVRRILLETTGNHNHIEEALKYICNFVKGRSAVFFNLNEDYNYFSPNYENKVLLDSDRTHFQSELIRYAREYYIQNNAALNIMCIKPDKHLLHTNPEFYELLKKAAIEEVAFSAVVGSDEQITILAVTNAKRSKAARMLAEKISACFYMALHNKTHLNKTELAATTEPLTGVFNRVSYKADAPVFDKEKPSDFSCIFVDVNELHLINNTYGHVAGDEMLIYVANSLKNVFYGNKIYRMGGDEFLVFVKDTHQDVIEESIRQFEELLKPKNYHVAIGVSYRSVNTNTEEMVKEAEVKMYEAKAKYYQNKEEKNIKKHKSDDYVNISTGIGEIDTMLSVMQEHYSGIYKVSLDTDSASRILMPAYLKYHENEEHFSQLFIKYVNESVDSDHRRSMMAFLNYEAIKLQLAEGKTPKIKYSKNQGESMILSVYKLSDSKNDDTLWVFARA